jgi:NADH-quinone oxidoreductase subunit J
MEAVFYISAAVALLSTLMVVTRPSAVHALLYLIVSLLAIAVIFFVLGAPFVAALEVIIYAGAIMVLFIFVVMMLNVSPGTAEPLDRRVSRRAWIGPGLLGLILLAELVYVFAWAKGVSTSTTPVTPQEVGQSLFGPYVLGVEIASLLLLSGLIGAYHLGRREKRAALSEGKQP